jgi:hypothetical protein
MDQMDKAMEQMDKDGSVSDGQKVGADNQKQKGLFLDYID